MSDTNPLAGRPGLRTESAETNALAGELGKLARAHGLTGCVLISFTGDRVGVNSSGEGSFADYMESLGDGMLAAIDDGIFDPETVAPPLVNRIELLAQRLYDTRDCVPCTDKVLWGRLDRHATALSKIAGRLKAAVKG